MAAAIPASSRRRDSAAVPSAGSAAAGPRRGLVAVVSLYLIAGGPCSGLKVMLLRRTVRLVRVRTADRVSSSRGQQGAAMPGKRRTIAGRSAMITGAASGIGRSLARRLSQAGSPVAIADLDDSGLKETA